MLLEKKQQKSPISMITCYDSLFASILAQSRIDALLIGDSLGTNCLGYDSEKEVSMADIIHHTKAVARSSGKLLLIADLPYNSYNDNCTALSNAKLLCDAGAHAVKFEGFFPDIVQTFKANSIPTICHLGLLPQTAIKKSVQAKDIESAERLYREAIELQSSGADALILELVPQQVAKQCSSLLDIPVIGIGAGPHCDGQVQVLYDILGFSPKQFRHAPLLANFRQQAIDVFDNYITAIQNNQLIDDTHSFNAPSDV